MTLDEFRSLLDEALAFYNSEHSGAQIDEGVAGGLGAIRYDIVQALAEAQKERARKNLGIDELPSGGGGGGNFEAVFDVTPASEIEAAYQAGKTITMNNNGVIYYLRERTSETRFEFTTPPYLIEMFSAIYIYTAVVDNFSWSMSSTKAESQSNKVTSISATSTNTQYPSAKAVFDFVKNNSGGGSVADLLNADGIIKQEYLPEGYPYPGESTLVEILPETTAVFDEENGIFLIMSGVDASMFTEGESYNVTYNGTEYASTAVIMYDNGIAAMCLGNVGAMTGGTDTGEPFVMIIMPLEMQPDMGVAAQIIPFDGAETVTVSISAGKELNTPIARKFLPEGYPYKEGEIKTIIDNPTLVFTAELNAFTSTDIISDKPTPGNSYTVNWNGIEYISTAIMQDGQVALGNIDVLTGSGNNGQPFVIIFVPDYAISEIGASLVVIPFDGATEVSVTVSGFVGSITKMSEEFLPSNLRPVLIVTGENERGGISFELSHSEDEMIAALNENKMVYIYEIERNESVIYKKYLKVWALDELDGNGGLVFRRMNAHTYGVATKTLTVLDRTAEISITGFPDKKIQLQSPDGLSWYIGVDNDGNISASRTPG